MTEKNHSFPENVCQKLDDLSEKVGMVLQILTGNGEPSKGLVIRVDRLEQSHGIITKVIWTLIGALVTPGAIGALFYYFINHSH